MFDEHGRKMIDRNGEPRRRPAHVPTPCSRCPKKSPEEAWRVELSANNLTTLSFYYEVQSTFGKALEMSRGGQLLLRKLGIIKAIFDSHERAMAYSQTAMLDGRLQALIATKKA